MNPLPHSNESERAVLGCLLIDSSTYWSIANVLQAADFYKDAHKTIYATIRELAAGGRGFDLITVKDQLAAEGKLSEVGGISYVASLTDPTPDMTSIERYVEIVIRNARLRTLVVAGNAMMNSAMDRDGDPEEIAGEALQRLSNVATREEAQARPMVEFIREAYAELERQRTGEAIGKLITGFDTLDGCRAIRRTFIAVGSPSKHGKTAFAVNLAAKLADHGHSIAMFSLESSEKETALRYVSTVGGVAHSRVQDWSLLRDDEYPKLAYAEATAGKQRVYLTKRVRTIDAIYAECRRLKTVYGLDAVFIDYIQLVKMHSGPRDREERIATISQTFLEIANDLDIAVVAMSQVNKDRMVRGSGRLYTADLKYAAAIGESARVVLLFHRPHMDDKSPEIPPCLVKFQIEANNENVTNDYEWHFNEITQTFGEGTCEQNRCRRAQRADTRGLYQS